MSLVDISMQNSLREQVRQDAKTDPRTPYIAHIGGKRDLTFAAVIVRYLDAYGAVPWRFEPLSALSDEDRREFELEIMRSRGEI